MMVADVTVNPQLGRQKPRGVPLYRKADWDGFRKYISVFVSDFMINYENLTVEQLLNSSDSDFQWCCWTSQGSPVARHYVGSVESSSLNLLGTFRDLFVLP